MKSISAPLLAHLAGQCITLATLWRVERQDGALFGFTDLDQSITYAGLVYEAATGYTPSNVETQGALAVDNLEIDGIISSDTITDEDLAAGKWDYAEITVKVVNYMDLSQGDYWVRRGRIGEVKMGRNSFVAELRGLTQNLQQTIGRAYTPTCSADLFSPQCGINKPSYTYNGAVVTPINQASFISDLLLPPGMLNNGLLTWTGGANQGSKIEVKFFSGAGAVGTTRATGTVSGGVVNITLPAGSSLAQTYRVIDSEGLEYEPTTASPSSGQYYQVGLAYQFNADAEGKAMTIIVEHTYFQGGTDGQIDLQLSQFYPIEAGDTFTVTAGCDKTLRTCADRYNNVINFRGFPYVRGPDALLAGPKR